MTDPWLLCTALRFVPQEVFTKMTAKGIIDSSKEVLGFLFRSNQGYPLVSELYLLISQLQLSFLAKLDKKDGTEYFKPDKVHERVEQLRPEFITYHCKI